MSNTFVVLCTRNRPQLLESLLRELEQQTCKITKVLIVDSSDKPLSKESFRSFSLSQIGEIDYVHSRPGLPYQRNVALNYLKTFWSESDTIHFLDDDVRVDPEFIGIAKSVLYSHPEASVVGAWDRNSYRAKSSFWRKVTLTGDLKNRGKLLPSGCSWPASNPITEEIVDWCPGFSLNFSANKLSDFWFDGRYRMYGEDVEACLRLSELGPIIVSPDLSLSHIQNDSGRDQHQAVAYFSDAFRLRLSRLQPQRISKFLVIWSSIALLVGELSASLVGASDHGVQKAMGHAKFLFDVLIGRTHEQTVEHNFLDLEPKFSFTVRNRRENTPTSQS